MRTVAEQRITCSYCGRSWVRLVMLENGGVTDEALDTTPCPSCRRQADPILDAELLPVRVGLLVAA